MAQDCTYRHRAFKSVDRALRLDIENRDHQAAYCQYVRSLSDACFALLEVAHLNVYPCAKHNDASKLLKLARQCLDRIEELGKKADCQLHKTKEQKLNVNHQNERENNNSLSVHDWHIHLSMGAGNNSNCQSLVDECNIDNRFVESKTLENFDTAVSTASVRLQLNPEQSKILTPLERVQRDNQHMMTAFRARFAMTHSVGAQIDLHLALQRRIAENVTLARAKQKNLVQCNEEKQKRLLEQATRKLARIKSIGPKEEESMKHLYAQILEYEQDQGWLLECKHKLAANPKDHVLIEQIVKWTLSTPQHPISKYLQVLQYRIYEEVKGILSQNAKLESVRESENKTCNHCNEADIIKRKDSTNGAVRKRSTNSINCVKQNESKRGNVAETTFSDNEYLACSPEMLQFYFDPIKVEKNASKKSSCNSADLLSEYVQCSVAGDGSMKQRCVNTNSDKNMYLGNLFDFEANNESSLMRHIHSIVFEACKAVEQLINILILTYEQLNCEGGRDRCYILIEKPFFEPMWTYLLQLFRLAYKTEEENMARIMIKFRSVTLKEFEVSQNYWGDKDHPYEDCINLMKTIVNFSYPGKKLEILVKVARLACEVKNHPLTSKSVGADDLIPILCYIVVQTQLPELVSECHAMEQFIHEGYLLGEEGYCLTSIQTVFQFLQSHPNILDSS